jgi:hypothetical protein
VGGRPAIGAGPAVGAGLAVGAVPAADAGLPVVAGLTAGVPAVAGVGSTTGPGPPMHSQPLMIMNVHGGLQAGTPAGRFTGPDEAPSAMATAVLSAKIPGMMSTRDIVPRQRHGTGAPRRCGTPRCHTDPMPDGPDARPTDGPMPDRQAEPMPDRQAEPMPDRQAERARATGRRRCRRRLGAPRGCAGRGSRASLGGSRCAGRVR